MKNKNVLLTTVAAILLLFGVLINDPFGFFADSYDKAAPLMKSFSIDRISKVNVSSGGKYRYLVKRQNEAWIIKDMENQKEYRADKSLIENNLKSLANTKKFQEVTSNQEKYAEHLVNETDFKIEIYSSNPDKADYNLILGNNGPSFNSTVVRLADEKTVYVVEGSLKSDWDRNVTQLRDRSLAHVDSASIQSVSLKGKNNYEFIRQSAKEWQIKHGDKTSKTQSGKVESIVKSISTLQGNSFMELPANARKVLELDITATNSMTFRIEIFEVANTDNGDQYFASSSTLKDFVSLSKSKVDEINQPKEVYIVEENAPADNLPVIPKINP